MDIPQQLILLYSKYSPQCQQILQILNGSSIDYIKPVCIDNVAIREQIVRSKRLNISTVPCILLVYTNNKIEKFEGKNVSSWLYTQISDNLPTANTPLNQDTQNMTPYPQQPVITQQEITPQQPMMAQQPYQQQVVYPSTLTPQSIPPQTHPQTHPQTTLLSAPTTELSTRHDIPMNTMPTILPVQNDPLFTMPTNTSDILGTPKRAKSVSEIAAEMQKDRDTLS